MAIRARLGLLIGLRQWDNAIACAEVELREFAGLADQLAEDRPARDELGWVRTLAGEAHWRGRGDRTAAMAQCLEATRTWREPPVLDLIREIDGLDASRSKTFLLVCEGQALVWIPDSNETPEEERVPKPTGYFLHSWALADSPEEGLESAHRFEAHDLGERLLSFRLDSSQPVEQAVKGCKGVYAGRLGRCWFG